jgi:hypothetical protein
MPLRSLSDTAPRPGRVPVPQKRTWGEPVDLGLNGKVALVAVASITGAVYQVDGGTTRSNV